MARLYHYKTKRVNETVRRNIERFPENFCFRLTEKEMEILRSQFATALNEKNDIYRNKKYLPYAFTEQGIAMLSGLLKNQIAIQVSINIMNAFVEMRNFLLSNRQVFERLTTIEYKLIDHDRKFNTVFNELQTNKHIKQNRFIIIDNKELYHCGASLKDLGKKCFGINQIEDMKYLQQLTKEI